MKMPKSYGDDESPAKKALREKAERAKYEAVGEVLAASYKAAAKGDNAAAGEAFCLALELERGY